MNFNEYYEHYLSLHQNLQCRQCHFVGQLVTLAYVVSAVYHGSFISLLLAPFVAYPFAWAGHYVFEKNTPAAFRNPIKAKISDWVMFKDIILGRIKIW